MNDIHSAVAGVGHRLASLSIFFPCYNDQTTIGCLVEQALTILPDLATTYEVVVVDDGSSDASRAHLQTLAAEHPQLRLICHISNQGYGAALQSGFRCCRSEWIFYTDGDGQYDPRDIRLLLPGALSGQVDWINGYKERRADPVYRVWIGAIYGYLVRHLFAIPIRDVTCDFRLMRKNLLNPDELTFKSGFICVELTAKLALAKARWQEVAVHHYPRPSGSSTYFRPARIFQTIRDFGRFLGEFQRLKRRCSPG
jgi:glycosyltransferase involved in cell wall biosynthesis